MESVDRHPLEPDVSFDGGDLDCGNGLLHCGFATFADNPVASADVAERKLRAIVEAAALVRRG